MKSIVILLAVVAIASAASLKVKRAAQIQKPLPAAALDALRGRSKLSVPDQYNLIATAKPGEDYPNLSTIPQTSFTCDGALIPGFYADTNTAARCQVFHRCDINGNQTSYLCPNMSLFNQITLTCSWFFDVDCSKTAAWAHYSNHRLYQGANVPLLDDVVRKLTGASASGSVSIKSVAAAPAPEAAEGEAPAE